MYPFSPVACSMSKLKVGDVRRMSTFDEGDDVVDRSRHRMGGAESLIDRLSAYSTDVLGCKNDPAINFKLRTVCGLSVWSHGAGILSGRGY